jgi:hypothetical protein
MRKARVIFCRSMLPVAVAIGLVTGAANTDWIAAAAPQQTADRNGWATYVNVRFQYSICYPKDLLVPQGESDNSDGQRFLSNKNGADLAAWGDNNASDQTLMQRLSEMASRLAGSSGKVTYKVQKANWLVVSGQNGQMIFYAKTIFSHGQFKTFELTYDRSAAALYDPVVARIASCFTDLAR